MENTNQTDKIGNVDLIELCNRMIALCNDENSTPAWLSWDAMPRNLNGDFYSGINVFNLSCKSRELNAPPIWGTFLNYRKMGGSVLKGEKSIAQVIYASLIKKVDNVTNEESQHYFIKSTPVYNILQTTLKDSFKLPKPLPNETEIQNLIQTHEIVIEQREIAAFLTKSDKIVLPHRDTFENVFAPRNCPLDWRKSSAKSSNEWGRKFRGLCS